MKNTKHPLDILDSLAGEITGNYLKDLKKAEALGITFIEKDYRQAEQLNAQP